MHSSCFSGWTSLSQSRKSGQYFMIGSWAHSVLTFTQTFRQAITGRKTSSEHHGNSDEQMRNLNCREHWLEDVSNTGRNILICKKGKRISKILLILKFIDDRKV